MDEYPKIIETPYGTLVLEEPSAEGLDWARERMMELDRTACTSTEKIDHLEGEKKCEKRK